MTESTLRPVGRPASVSRAEIVAKAEALVRSEGFDALSMRRLGRELGVDPMVPYRIFPSKDKLLDAVYDNVVSRAEPGASGDPITDVIAGYRNFWRDLIENPGLIPLTTPRMLATKAAMAPFEWVMERLVAAGLDVEAALLWYTTLLSYTLGAASIHPDVQQRAKRVDLGQLDPRLYPTVSDLAGKADHDRLYREGLIAMERQIREAVAA